MGGSSGVEETGWRERGGVRCGRESQGLTRQGGELHEAERRRFFTGGMLLLPTNAQSAGFLATLD